MAAQTGDPPDWLRTLRLYLGVSIAIHFVWEILQLPLYTLWSTGTVRQQAFAVLHCTIGDAMIAALAMLLALVLTNEAHWPQRGTGRVFMVSLTLGIAYTIYSEWLNVSVRGSWAYAPKMPLVPILGTGLSPLLQWVLVPSIAQWVAVNRLKLIGKIRS